MKPFFRPSVRYQAEIEIKRSRFIAIVAPAEGVSACEDFVRSVRAEFPDARHHCVAFIGGAPWNSQSYGMSDDGEPSGTAGKPMFNVLQHSGLGQVVVVVVRYFGGIKLGTGGLVKAYSQVTHLALEGVERTEVRPRFSIEITADYPFESDIRHWLGVFDAHCVESTYSEQVMLTAYVENPSALADRLQQTGQGKIRFHCPDLI